MIGVLGGTFDPPHYGHLAAAEEVRYRLQLDSILWLPAGAPPHKAHTRVALAGHRLEMLRLATADNPRFEISEIELRLEGPSYTARTLRELKAQDPQRRLRFIIGSDEFASLSRWYEPRVVVELAELVVMVRAGVSFDPLQIEAELPCVVGRYQLVTVPDLPLSSSDLRARVRAGLPIRYLVPEGVRRYIEAHGLYVS